MLNKITSVTAAAVVGIATTVAGAQSAAVQWRVEDGGNGHWYQCLRTTGSGEVWTVSQAAANALGGHLATLTSQQENSWVYELSVAQIAWSGRGGPLLGGYKLPDNSFRWVTDEPWSYTSWLPGEPSSGLWEPYLNFLGPQGTTSSGATWNDTDAIVVPDNSGDPTYTYIVEWGADCNNDNITDYGQCHNGTLADYNTNNVPDCCEQGVQCTVGNYPVQWRVEDGGNGHWYQGVGYPTQGVSWTAAREDASIHGAELVTFESLTESSWVFSAIVAQESMWNLDCGPWVGAYQSTGSVEPSGGWIWVDGTPVGSTFNWAASQPDDARNCGGDNNRMHYWRQGSAVPINLLADAPDAASFTCDQGYVGIFRSAVFEWSADCNNDNIVDYGQILNGTLPDTNTNNIPDCCEPGNSCCLGDIYVNHIIDGGDLGVLLSEWGVVTPTTRSDLNRDGFVDGADLGRLLANWGPCGG
jgi:hypothetical protein